MRTSVLAASAILAGILMTTPFANAADRYNFGEGYLEIDVNVPLTDNSANSVSFTKTLPLGRYDATLTVAVSYYAPDNYYSAMFATSGAPSFGGDGLGQRGPLWPYSSVWNLREKEQVIYADGIGLDAMLRDLETKFNGAAGRVGFRASGDLASGTLTISMRNK